MAIEIIRKARKAAKVSQEKLADLVGVSISQISRIERGERRATLEQAQKIAKALRISLHEIAEDGFAEPDSASEFGVAEPGQQIAQATIADIPILGAVGAGDFQPSPQTKEEQAPRPPGLRDRKGVYALYVVGNAMAPDFRSGDLIYVDSYAPPAPADYAVFQAARFGMSTAARRFFLRFGGTDGDWLVFKQLAPPAEDRFRAPTVEWMHRVIPKTELG